MNDLHDLLNRYDKPGPRYTSYPTAPVWNDQFTAEDYRERLRAAGQRSEPMSLYTHIPYCNALCLFCGCSMVVTQRHEKEQPYVDRVLHEAAMVHEAMGSTRPIVQHHWGGGTPTFLSPAMLEKLFVGLCELFPLTDDAEVSIEIDPRVTTREQLESLAKVGFNRISMGVQDFDLKVQETINRVQSFEQTELLVTAARDLGFTSVNLDLIYGLPYQTVEGFERTLDLVHELSPDRIACYGYAHVPWIRKHQKVLPENALPQGSAKLDLYLAALDNMVAHGYAAIGMDHFAKNEDELAVAANNGTLHRNFMGYSTHPAEDMVSFGMSAISEMDGAFSHNEKDLKGWETMIDADQLPVHRGMVRSVDDDQRRRIILDLMCHFRLEFNQHGGADDFRTRYASELQSLDPMVADGLVSISSDEIAITETGRLFVRNICMAFDAYLDHDTEKGPRYSRTV